MAALASADAQTARFPQDDLKGFFGPAGARSWDVYTRQAYLSQPDGEWDGLNDAEENMAIALWGEVEKDVFAWNGGIGAGSYSDLSAGNYVQSAALPFTLQWGSSTWTNIWVSKNGSFSLGTPAMSSTSPAPLPVDTLMGTFFCVYWHDLVMDTTAGSRMWTYAPDSTRFIVCWENFRLPGSAGSLVSFQAEIRPNGEMIWRYRDLNPGSTPPPPGTVGVQRYGFGWSLSADMLKPSLSLRVMPIGWVSPFDADTDGDGVVDGIEFYYFWPNRGPGRFLNPTTPDNPGDIDRDGLDVTQEFLHGRLDIFFWDTDGDMLGDGYEAAHRMLGNNATGIHGLNGDADGDGISNIRERLHRTHPRLDDTDGDRRPDPLEVASSSNPAGPGALNDLRLLAPVRLTLGDFNYDGATDAYKMDITPISGDVRSFTFQNTEYGALQSQDLMLVVGGRYRISLDHLGSVRASNLYADPDYEATVQGINGTIVSVIDPNGLMGRHIASAAISPGTPPVNTNVFATLWIMGYVPTDGGPAIFDPILSTHMEAWGAGRDPAAPPVPAPELTDPGVLMLPQYSPAMGAIEPAKLRLHGVSGGLGLTRWLRISDPALVSYRLPGMGAFAPATTSEIQIPGDVTADVDVQLQARGTWPIGATALATYVIKASDGSVVLEHNSARFIGQVVAAIGDSLTYGFRRDRTGHHQMPLWGEPWLNYPTASAWTGFQGNWYDINYQGPRGFLQRDLTPSIPWAGHYANGHGPDHCGFPGSTTINLYTFLEDPSRVQPLAAVHSAPSYMVVIYFLGANDVVGGRASSYIYNDWARGINNVIEHRAGRGRTVIVGVTVPKMEKHYAAHTDDRQRQLVYFNSRVRRHTVSAPFVRYVVADVESVPHDLNDDGLHFMDVGYSRIEQVIRQAIVNGLKAQ